MREMLKLYYSKPKKRPSLLILLTCSFVLFLICFLPLVSKTRIERWKACVLFPCTDGRTASDMFHHWTNTGLNAHVDSAAVRIMDGIERRVTNPSPLFRFSPLGFHSLNVQHSTATMHSSDNLNFANFSQIPQSINKLGL